MPDARTLLAAGLGLLLGGFLLAYPEAALRVQLAGRVPTDRRGEYGDDTVGSDRLRLVVRALGVLVALVGGYIGLAGFGVV